MRRLALLAVTLTIVLQLNVVYSKDEMQCELKKSCSSDSDCCAAMSCQRANADTDGKGVCMSPASLAEEKKSDTRKQRTKRLAPVHRKRQHSSNWEFRWDELMPKRSKDCVDSSDCEEGECCREQCLFRIGCRNRCEPEYDGEFCIGRYQYPTNNQVYNYYL